MANLFDTPVKKSGGNLFDAPRSKKSSDLSTLEGLSAKAEEAGYGRDVAKIVDTKPKLSVLQRLSKGLGAFNPAEAILTGKEKGLFSGLYEYPKRIVQGVGSALTGQDYGGTQRGFKDVAEDFGVENGIAKFGLGFVGDVLLDPTTYLGGAIAKGLTSGARAVGSGTLKGIAKVSPEAEEGIKLIGTGLQDALGRAFKYGYKSSEGASTDVLTFLSKEQQALLGLASSNLARLGTGVLSKSQQEELALKLIAGKRAEFVAREAGASLDEAATAAREAAQSADETVQKIINDQSARSKKFAEAADIENPYETYFPFLKKEKVKSFVDATRGIQVGSEAYKKQFKNLLTNENLELDPAKAFFSVEARAASDRMTRDFLTGFVGKYGKPLAEFSNSDEAAKAGYQLIREKGIFGKELGYVSKYDANLLRDSLSPEFQAIDMLAKATGFDAITSLFKRSVTGLFAPFHIRNFISGHIQNFEAIGTAALNPRLIASGQKIAYLMGKGQKIPAGTVQLGGKPVKLQTVMKPFVNRFSGDTFYNADFDTALKSGGALKSAAPILSGQRVKETFKTAGLGTEAIPFKVARAIGQYIEHQQKATAYLAALDMGKSIKEALALAEKAGFDYRALTRFESQVMRRIVPFYSFARKNIGLQLGTLGTNPQRINQILSFFENMGEPLSEEEKQNLPAFMQEVLGPKLKDTPNGLRQYLTGFGTPIEAFSQLVSGNPILRGISQMNPLLKVPIELGTGKDSFRQRDVKDTYNADEYKSAPQFVKDLLEIKEVQKDVLKKNAQGKLVKVGERTEYVANPERLLIARSLFTSRGVTYLDEAFNGDLQGFLKALKLTTGIRVSQVDFEKTKSLNERDKRRELEDLLTKTGEVSRFTKVYEPKE